MKPNAKYDSLAACPRCGGLLERMLTVKQDRGEFFIEQTPIKTYRHESGRALREGDAAVMGEVLKGDSDDWKARSRTRHYRLHEFICPTCNDILPREFCKRWDGEVTDEMCCDLTPSRMPAPATAGMVMSL